MGWAKYDEDNREICEENNKDEIIYYSHTYGTLHKNDHTPAVKVKSRKAAGFYIKYPDKTVKYM